MDSPSRPETLASSPQQIAAQSLIEFSQQGRNSGTSSSLNQTQSEQWQGYGYRAYRFENQSTPGPRHPFDGKCNPENCIVSSPDLAMTPSGNKGDLASPSKICPPHCADSTSSHPDIIDQPCRPNCNCQLQILPLTKNNARTILASQAGRHYFEYDLKTQQYAYWGRVTFRNRDSKRARLADLLADYVYGLEDCIAERRLFTRKKESGTLSPEDVNDLEWIEQTKSDLRRKRGRVRLLSNKAFPGDLARDLGVWLDAKLKENYENMPYYQYFSFLKKENVWEMFALLMDKDCKDIRDAWNEVFAAHIIGTKGLEDILDEVEFLENWKKRSWDDEDDCAWKWLNRCDFEDLVVVYDVGECDEDVLLRGSQYHCQIESEEEDEDEYEEEDEGQDEGYHPGKHQVDDDETLDEESSPSANSSTPSDSDNSARTSSAGKKKTGAKAKNKGKGKAVDRTVATGRVQKGKKATPTTKATSTGKKLITTTIKIEPKTKATSKRKTLTKTTIKIKLTTKTTSFPKSKADGERIESPEEPATKKRKESPDEATENSLIIETRTRGKKVKHVHWRNEGL